MIQPAQIHIKDNGTFPGSKLPVLHYKKAIKVPFIFAGRKAKALFTKHNWTNTWRGGIYTYDHYHSNTHEAMAVIKCHTVLLLGGENGKHVHLEKGDVIVIPAGVAHKNLGKEKDVICIGGYPDGKDFDMNYGNAGERPGTDENIRSVPMPLTGPLYGEVDPLAKIWEAFY